MSYPPEARAIGMVFFIVLIICIIFFMAIVAALVAIAAFKVLQWTYRRYLKPKLIAKGWIKG
jgi:hypothetical protein